MSHQTNNAFADLRQSLAVLFCCEQKGVWFVIWPVKWAHQYRMRQHLGCNEQRQIFSQSVLLPTASFDFNSKTPGNIWCNYTRPNYELKYDPKCPLTWKRSLIVCIWLALLEHLILNQIIQIIVSMCFTALMYWMNERTKKNVWNWKITSWASSTSLFKATLVKINFMIHASEQQTSKKTK